MVYPDAFQKVGRLATVRESKISYLCHTGQFRGSLRSFGVKSTRLLPDFFSFGQLLRWKVSSTNFVDSAGLGNKNPPMGLRSLSHLHSIRKMRCEKEDAKGLASCPAKTELLIKIRA